MNTSLVPALLMVGSDPVLYTSLKEQFETVQKDLNFSYVETLPSALMACHKEDVSLIVLDSRKQEGISGGEACAHIRNSGCQKPVIVMIEEEKEGVLQDLFRSGANDYIVKPFRFHALAFRIKMQLKKMQGLKIGSCFFYPSTKTLTSHAGKNIRLTEKEANLLTFLMQNAGRTISKDTLLTEIWGYGAQIATHTLETHVYRLRQKLRILCEEAEKALVTKMNGYKIS